MEQTWRWFGPDDPVTLAHVRQAGASGVVSALYGQYDGSAWPQADVAAHKVRIEAAGLRWSVVESIPVPNEIKLGGVAAQAATQSFCDSMRAVAAAGIDVICYNFMPVVDWTRTDLRHEMPSGGLALRFDMIDFIAYDVGILDRPGAVADYDPAQITAAGARLTRMDAETRARLEKTIIAGLPGSELVHDRAGIAAVIARYDDLGPDDLRANLAAFHKVVVPLAASLGLRLCIHPDDPPFPLFGLPRIASTAADFDKMFGAVPEPENGLTLCVGSLSSRRDNDVRKIFESHASRVHFLHLRNVTVEDDGSFVESDHLDGDTDMVDLVQAVLAEEARRRQDGRPDHSIPFRPDHGHLLIDDQDKQILPGYSAIGRLKGLAELRGVIRALERTATRDENAGAHK